MTAGEIPSFATICQAGSFSHRVRREGARMAPVVAAVVLYAALAVGADRLLGLGGRIRPQLSSAPLSAAVLLYYPLAAMVFAVWIRLVKGSSLFDRSAWRPFAARHLSMARLLSVAILMLCIPVVASVFTDVKASIPLIQPFAWDRRFMELDRTLHLGRHPWQVLQPVLGVPAVTRALDVVYFLWFPIVWFTFAWQLAGGREPGRTRFLLTFVLSAALLGSAAAVMFSSAGPCYYGNVESGPDPYLGLFAYLRSVGDPDSPIKALWGQALLWENYSAGGADAFSAISAFPSMHVSMAVLLSLVTWPLPRPVRWFYFGFAAAILIGSIHLGWHYAVDGYAAVLATWVLWRIAGRLVPVAGRSGEGSLSDEVTSG